MSTITIEVDGKELEAEAGEMLICVTDRNDIYIPRFCYHEKLSIAANCRMCLVEVEKAPKPMPACATPVMDGMKVFTRSELASEAQKGTMEFLLINHPLDCPVCDQGGECPLQDQAMGYGKDDSRFNERKRSVPSYDIGPLVATEMTRCIHCTRCVRFGEEVAGVMEMGAPGRGEFMQISTFLNRSIDSEVSGNIIDLCPVGALTSKPYRFAARSWELRDHASISPHDCLGTNLNIQTLRDQVERVLPIENPDINECWLADRDRYSYEAVNCEHRLTKPMIKKKDKWKETDWESALAHASAGIKTVMESRSTADIGGLATPSSTLEEFYLLQKLIRNLGSENVDHRLQQCDFREDAMVPGLPGSELPIKNYSTQKSVLLVGSNIRKEQPLLALRLRDGCKNSETKISAINPIDFEFNFDTVEVDVAPGLQMVRSLANLAARIASQKFVNLPEEIGNLTNHKSNLDQTAKNIIEAGGNGIIVIGGLAQQHTDSSLLNAIAQWICETSGASLSVLPPANSTAGWLANCLPGSKGENAGQMLTKGLKAYVLLGTEPELDCIDGKASLKVLKKSDFVVQISAYKSESVNEYADVVLPMAAFTESAGTYVNCEGRVQKANVAATPKGDARPAWKILRVLGNFLDVEGFDQVSIDDVTAEIDISNSTPSPRFAKWEISKPLSKESKGLLRVADIPMYRSEITLRHADALQKTADNPTPAANINPATAIQMNLEDGDKVSVRNGTGKTKLPVRSDRRVPENCVYIPAGFSETAKLGGHVSVNLEKS